MERHAGCLVHCTQVREKRFVKVQAKDDGREAELTASCGPSQRVVREVTVQTLLQDSSVKVVWVGQGKVKIVL